MRNRLLLALLFGPGSVAAQIEYRADNASPANAPADWTPTAMEEEIRWHLNRGRFDPPAENARRGTSYGGLPSTAGPLAPHYSLTASSRRHSEDLARTNRFQHQTVPGSAFYNPTTQPNPSHRMIAEGYTGGTTFSENVAGGRSTGLAAYLAWWGSDGHRNGMYGAQFREIGNGYFYHASSTYKHYHTMNLASSGVRHLFTGTIFQDTNANGAYDIGEGRGGFRVELRVNGAPHGHFDISSGVGSFAVPIDSIAAGSVVEVRLRNPGSSTASVTIPTSHTALAAVTFAAGEERVWGTFVKPASATNVGFRNLTVVNLASLEVPPLALRVNGKTKTLTWPSRTGLLYQVQWSADFINWTNLSALPMPGTGLTMSAVDTSLAPRRSYRLVLTRAL